MKKLSELFDLYWDALERFMTGDQGTRLSIAATFVVILALLSWALLASSIAGDLSRAGDVSCVEE